MKLTNHSAVPVYTISGSSTARPLPDWLARKRKRSLKTDPEFANRVELLQDFEFEEASQCIRVSDDGQWIMSTGTYKPQIHTHYLPHLSLSFARHTSSLNTTFLLLSSDYSKSLHLQSDRSLEFHTPQGCHYTTRTPRYGRDLKYDKRAAEALIPSVGVNADGNGEVFRLNLEVGRFMRGYEVDVGGDDMTSAGGGALQGGIAVGSVNVAAIAAESHNLLAFGTSLGTVEFWDGRSRSRVGILALPSALSGLQETERAEITALEFHQSGLTLASGTSTGLIYTYDLRSPIPLIRKDQGYGYPIQTLTYLQSTTESLGQDSSSKLLSADKRIIKIWEPSTGTPWTSVEPAVDLNSVAWCKDSGMLLTANEGRAQHAFFIPQLGPAPKWCSFLDNLVEEMAENPDDPSSFNQLGDSSAGAVYDNYKFLTTAQLRALNLEHLIGTTSLLRPYMHGYFVAQRLYEEARLIADPYQFEEERAKSVKAKIDKERESRIRGSKKELSVKVNRRLAERMLEREEKNERRKAKRVLEKGGDDALVGELHGDAKIKNGNKEEAEVQTEGKGVLADPRFAKLFQDEEFAVDETSRAFQELNPSTKPSTSSQRERGLTAVEEEALASEAQDSGSDLTSNSESEEQTRPLGKDSNRISSASYKRSGHRSQRPQQHMRVSSSKAPQRARDRSFGSRSAVSRKPKMSGKGNVVGEREVTFAPERKGKKHIAGMEDGKYGNNDRSERRDKGRRSASGNVFRNM
ncbi:MAG: hypothetical protein M1835_004670 [Candelina submexicana]|nr:MAG: hypothetical protein M1835_004670 [Candelina submexicana]